MRLWPVVANACCSMLLALGSALLLLDPVWSSEFADDRAVVNTPGDGFLALRSEPTIKSGKRLAKIPHGTKISLGDCQPASDGSHWCQTTYNGVTGWVFDRYLLLNNAAHVNRATSGGDRPVMVGEDPGYDACASVGVVSGLKPGGDGFLALRSGPSINARLIGKLYEGDVVILCDYVTGWQGVVVSPSDPEIDCGTSSPVASHQPYNGPCRAGWVSDKFITVIAG